MPPFWEKLDSKEKVWLGTVYGVSLLLVFLLAYNLGQNAVQPPAQQAQETTMTHPEGDSVRPMTPPPNPDAPVQAIDLDAPQSAASITVHVAGQVNKPGVYTPPSGSRIRDALQQAGGVKPEADLDGVNLAEPLSDGMKIYVPHKAETHIETAFNDPQRGNRSTTPSAPSPPRFPLDINRASAEELEALPGIGPVLAARIVEYRQQHGRFQSVDELIEVRGIGPKRLEQIRPYVVVR